MINMLKYRCSRCGDSVDVVCLHTGKCVKCLSMEKVRIIRKQELRQKLFDQMIKEHGDKPISCMNDGCGLTLTIKEAHKDDWMCMKGIIVCSKCLNLNNVYIKVG